MVEVVLYIDVCNMVSCVSLFVCSAVYPIVCASRLEVYGGVCSVKGLLKSGYIVFSVELCT